MVIGLMTVSITCTIDTFIPYTICSKAASIVDILLIDVSN